MDSNKLTYTFAGVALVLLGLLIGIVASRAGAPGQSTTTKPTDTSTPKTGSPQFGTNPEVTAPPKAAPLTPAEAKRLWEANEGVNIVESDDAVPEFPKAFPRFAPTQPDTDFWGDSFKWRGTIRLFQDGEGWTDLTGGGGEEFPKTMNGCASGVWMLRWRTDNPDVLVQSAKGYDGDVFDVNQTAIGSYGYMSGTNCEQPMFRFRKAINGNGSNMVDLRFEFKFWEGAP